ncbi:MAG: zincin-like metallopeptidase domain-containing protein [Campylobacterota bacterium]|nr:zincin-like metallopeptidase domain-containing protein [Campylobacterota bacterium]
MENKQNYPTTKEKYQEMVNQFVSQLEQGTAPWTKSWMSGGLPKNFASGNQYNGMNILTLMNQGFNDNRFLTFNQVKKLGGSVKKGEKSAPIFFMKPIEKETVDDGGEKHIEKYFVMQSYQVFNIEQTDGIEYDKHINPKKNEVLSEAQEFIDTVKEDIPEFAGSPAYSVTDDCIFMPDINRFEDSFNYYSTYFHELSHATGHPKRLNREDKQLSKFGDPKYAYEELIAELSSSFLCSDLKVPMDTTRHTEYLSSWVTALKEKPNILFSAASQASKSTNFLKEMVQTKKQEKTKTFSPKLR